MIRTRRWKLVRRYPDGPHDLFDLARDSQETRHLAGDAPARPGRPPGRGEADLTARLDAFYTRYDDRRTSGLRVAALPHHNSAEAWRDGLRELCGG